MKKIFNKPLWFYFIAYLALLAFARRFLPPLYKVFYAIDDFCLGVMSVYIAYQIFKLLRKLYNDTTDYLDEDENNNNDF